MDRTLDRRSHARSSKRNHSSPWKWFFRLVVTAGVLVVGFISFYAFAMTHANVNHSSGWIPIGDASNAETMTGTFPASATKFCFASSSIGMGGRFHAYALDGEIEELQTFAEAEFVSHWDKPDVKVERNVLSPFESDYITRLERTYSVDLTWLRASAGTTGSLYRDASNQTSHRPTIFVDDTNAMLYFVMTD